MRMQGEGEEEQDRKGETRRRGERMSRRALLERGQVSMVLTRALAARAARLGAEDATPRGFQADQDGPNGRPDLSRRLQIQPKRASREAYVGLSNQIPRRRMIFPKQPRMTT